MIVEQWEEFQNVTGSYIESNEIKKNKILQCVNNFFFRLLISLFRLFRFRWLIHIIIIIIIVISITVIAPDHVTFFSTNIFTQREKSDNDQLIIREGKLDYLMISMGNLIMFRLKTNHIHIYE